MTLNFYEDLSSDYVKLLENGDEHNIIVEVGEPPAMQTFKVHSTVLRYRCPYLYDEFKKSTTNNNDNIRIIQKPQISAKVFNIIIKYVYGAAVNLENVETSIIFDLLMAANQFLLEKLVARLQTFLIENYSSWLKLNFSKIYCLGFQIKFTALQNFCNDIIVKHPDLIFESNDFDTLPEAALVSIIQRDDLQLEEPKVWDYVIQWGTAQNKDLPSNLNDWTEKDFQILKNTLQQCLPHIRYFQFSNEHIVEKIYPYQQILEKNLMSDILKYYISPNEPISSTILPPRNIFQITSSIISNAHATEIASWIDKKEVTYEINKNPYDFNLILRGSRDGFEKDVFWNLCNQKTNIVVVAKVKYTDEIVGGYNPIDWNFNLGKIYSKTSNSFIFSLKNGFIKNSIISRVKVSCKAIYNNPEFVSNFGLDFFMSKNRFFRIDLVDGYEKPIRKETGGFLIDDYEVFQISKRKIQIIICANSISNFRALQHSFAVIDLNAQYPNPVNLRSQQPSKDEFGLVDQLLDEILKSTIGKEKNCVDREQLAHRIFFENCIHSLKAVIICFPGTQLSKQKTRFATVLAIWDKRNTSFQHHHWARTRLILTVWNETRCALPKIEETAMIMDKNIEGGIWHENVHTGILVMATTRHASF
ncbi:hypothetical protein Glove_553g17 [Diversispora epigaea]|uniref:BTB domain-containing protein n=1 Tax=Diversispora epigaea TaxID=1348612 RepID=A0A397GBJ3_9GLOM|nr:hypothetical protein Glove_553g17 [Diversispora epigaea]